MTSRVAAIVVAVGFLAACTSSGEPPEPASFPVSASAYSFDLIDQGASDRHPLVALVPVGRRAQVQVTMSSVSEAIDVMLEASVVQASADGSSQLVRLEITGVDSDDASTVEALAPIIGASASLVRDRRLSVVEQTLEVPAGLAFRADTVARQALRAPFALVGPLALDVVGDGAVWTVTDAADAPTTVEVVASSAEEFQLRFDVPGGSVELTGRSGALLPSEQIITLDNAALVVTAERLN